MAEGEGLEGAPVTEKVPVQKRAERKAGADRPIIDMAAKPTKKKMGRPPKIESPASLDSAISEYIDSARSKKEPILITGFCLYAGICRDTLRKYAAKKEFIVPIKKLQGAVLHYAESCLFKGSGQVAGPIFYLKNNFPDLYKDDGIRLMDGHGAPLKITVNFVNAQK